MTNSFSTPWTVAHQALLSTEFSRQEYWSGRPSPTAGDFPNPGIKSPSPESPASANRFFTAEPSGKPPSISTVQFSSVQSLSRVQLFATPWTVAHQILLSTEFSRQEYWSRLSFPSPGDLPNPGIKSSSPALAGRFYTTEPSESPILYIILCIR